MPLYEYECRSCHQHFELLVRESTEFECPSCHGHDLEKQLSVVAVSATAGRPAPVAAGPCGACGHPDGPGSCSVN
ncbi:MAG: zinc ribbon domain-containing protein [Vicinamibacterales bacterium]